MTPKRLVDYILEGREQWQVPANVRQLFDQATTAQEVSDIITKYEAEIALPEDDGYLGCDEAAALLSQELKKKGIQHKVVWGYVDDGSGSKQSHAYVRAGGVALDPTKQGTVPEAEEQGG